MKYSLLALSCVVLFGAGCSGAVTDKITEKVIESQTGGQVDVDSGDGQVTFNDKKTGTSVSVGGDVKIPDGFPKDVPVYPGSKVNAVASDTQGSLQYSLILETEDKAMKVADWYTEQLKGAGWEEVRGYTAGPTEFRSFKKENAEMSIMAAGTTSGGKTTITIGRGEKK